MSSNLNDNHSPSPRLFKISISEEKERIKEQTIKGTGLLSRSQTMEQGIQILENIIPTLSKITLSIFLPIIFRVKTSNNGKDNPEPRAIRAVVHILGELVHQLPSEFVIPFASKIIHNILYHLQYPDGSIDKMHEQCARSLSIIAYSIPPGPVIGSLFQLYNTKKRIGENFFHLQNGLSLCLQNVLKIDNVIEYLSNKPESLKKLVTKLLSIFGNQNEYSPAPILQVWIIILNHIPSSIEIINTYAPQLISNAIQALSSSTTTDSKKTFLAEKSIFWKNRAEAGRLLALIPTKLSPNICNQYSNEVLNYLDQCKHDRIKQVRDEVSSAINEWKNLIEKKTSQRTGKPRMEFSSFSYSKDNKPIVKNKKKERTPIREFIKQKKGISPSVNSNNTNPPVVLIPQKSSPYKQQSNDKKQQTNIFSSDEPQLKDIDDIPHLSSINDISLFSHNSPLNFQKNEEKHIEDDEDDSIDVISISDINSPQLPIPQYSTNIPSSKLSYESTPLPTPTLSDLAPPVSPTIEIYSTPKRRKIQTRKPQSIPNTTNTKFSMSEEKQSNDDDKLSNYMEQSQKQFNKLEQLIEKQQEQINILSNTVNNAINQRVDTITKQDTSIKEDDIIFDDNINEQDNNENILNNSKEEIKDLFSSRIGINENTWEDYKIILNQNKNDDIDEFTNIFANILLHGNENQCFYILKTYVNSMEYLSNNELQNVFNIIIYFIENKKYSDITIIWITQLLKIYTPLQSKQIEILASKF